MIMMMIVMMLAMTPRIEARLSLCFASCTSRARAGHAHEAPGKQRTLERRPAKLRLLEATVLLCARALARRVTKRWAAGCALPVPRTHRERPNHSYGLRA